MVKFLTPSLILSTSLPASEMLPASPRERVLPQPYTLLGRVPPLQIWPGAATLPNSSWMPPQRPGSRKCLSLGSPIKTYAQAAEPPLPWSALTIGHGGYRRLRHWGAASVCGPDGIAAIAVRADQRAATALPAQALQLLWARADRHEQGSQEQRAWAADSSLPHKPGSPGRCSPHTVRPGSR